MKTMFTRKKHIIRDAETKEIVFTGSVIIDGLAYRCINAAKRESRKLQLSNGGLGMGSLVVIR